MPTYKYSQTWFMGSEIKGSLLTYLDIDNKHTILEIGCFEGLSSVFFADNLLNNADSSLTCVDPFLNIDTNDHASFLQNAEEANFDYNITTCRNSAKVSVKKITSDSFFETNTTVYSFIYIDGCHECDFITRDMENSFRWLESGGIMWMDDYGGGSDGSIRRTMDSFLVKYAGQYEIIHKGYQLAIRKNK